MSHRPEQIDAICKSYLNARANLKIAQENADGLHDVLLAAVEREGHTPARAIKSKALAGDQYEIRVSYPAEVTVDTGAALRLRNACLNRGGGSRLFRRLLKTVETFVLADGAHGLINRKKLPAGAPSGLRSLFARALRVKELSPQVEVRERGVDGQSSPSGKDRQRKEKDAAA